MPRIPGRWNNPRAGRILHTVDGDRRGELRHAHAAKRETAEKFDDRHRVALFLRKT